MPYDKETEDRALNRLYKDCMDYQERGPAPRPKPSGIGAPFAMLAGLILLAVFLMVAGGCNTLAGVGADLEAAAKGTQEYLAQPDPYTAR